MKLKKGFTLIELVVVIALIAILAVTLAPRLRDQIAKANDAKAVALLGSMRTQSEIFFAENGRTVEDAEESDFTELGLDKDDDPLAILIAGLDSSSKKMFDDAGNANGEWTADELEVNVGGTRADETAAMEYGGKVGFTFTDPNTTRDSGDGVELWFGTITSSDSAVKDPTHDTKRNEWGEY